MQKKNRCRVIVCVSCCWFLPPDAVPASADTTYVCPSLCHKSEFYWNGWTNRDGFGHGSFFHLCRLSQAYTMFVCTKCTQLYTKALYYKNSCIYKIRVFSFGTLPHTLDFKKFHHYRSIVEMCYQLSLTQVNDQSVIDWTVVDQQSWQLYLRVPTVDRQVIVKLCLQHDSIARVYQGQLTTPARHGKSLSCQAVWIESRDRLAKSEQ